LQKHTDITWKRIQMHKCEIIMFNVHRWQIVQCPSDMEDSCQRNS
jgi:hypothetical protein